MSLKELLDWWKHLPERTPAMYPDPHGDGFNGTRIKAYPEFLNEARRRWRGSEEAILKELEPSRRELGKQVKKRAQALSKWWDTTFRKQFIPVLLEDLRKLRESIVKVNFDPEHPANLAAIQDDGGRALWNESTLRDFVEVWDAEKALDETSATEHIEEWLKLGSAFLREFANAPLTFPAKMVLHEIDYRKGFERWFPRTKVDSSSGDIDGVNLLYVWRADRAKQQLWRGFSYKLDDFEHLSQCSPRLYARTLGFLLGPDERPVIGSEQWSFENRWFDDATAGFEVWFKGRAGEALMPQPPNAMWQQIWVPESIHQIAKKVAPLYFGSESHKWTEWRDGGSELLPEFYAQGPAWLVAYLLDKLAELAPSGAKVVHDSARSTEHKIADALLIIRDNPNASLADIGKEVGLSASTLSRNEAVKRARQRPRTLGTRGSKSKDGTLEAWREEE